MRVCTTNGARGVPGGRMTAVPTSVAGVMRRSLTCWLSTPSKAVWPPQRKGVCTVVVGGNVGGAEAEAVDVGVTRFAPALFPPLQPTAPRTNPRTRHNTARRHTALQPFRSGITD